MPTEENIFKMVFGMPIGPGERTLGQILGRKAAKRGLREALGVGKDDGGGKPRPVSRGKRAMEEPNAALAKMALLNMIAKMADMEKEAPFKSKAQQRWMFAAQSRGEVPKGTAERWARHTKDIKSLPEKKAAAGILAGIGRGLLSAGKSIGKSMVWPSTGKQLVAGTGIWSGIGAAGAAKAGPSFRYASVVDRLVEMTKEALEIRDYMPASTDTVDPIVKKNSMSKHSALVFPGPVGARGTFGATRGRSWSTKFPGEKWMDQSTTKGRVWKAKEGPDVRKTTGLAPEERTTGAEVGGHIQRPSM